MPATTPTFPSHVQNSPDTEELLAFLRANSIDSEEVCIVGGFVLSHHGIRPCGDIDVIARSCVRRRFQWPETATKLTAHVEVVGRNWARNLGISDDLLIGDSRYHQTVNGIKLCRLEVLFALYQRRSRQKDSDDSILIAESLSEPNDWDWSLVRDCLTLADRRRLSGSAPLRRNPVASLVRRSKFFFRSAKNACKSAGALPRRVISKARTALQRIQRNMMWRRRGQNSPMLDAHARLQTTTFISTGDLLGLQRLQDEFCRYDVLLRYLVAQGIDEESHAHQNAYQQMQGLRVGKCDYARFVDLVKNIKDNGFSDKYPLPISEEGRLIDGAHRLACALYFGIDEVPVRVLETRKRVDFSRPWFESRGFGDELLVSLDLCREALFERTGVFFPVMLWPAVEPWYREIIADLRRDYRVVWARKLDLGRHFAQIVEQLYETDDIPSWKVQLKLHCLEPYGSTLCMAAVELPEPRFRQKAKTGKCISQTGEKIKRDIRKQYRGRVDNYFYDMICHTGDSHRQNREIFSILGRVPEILPEYKYESL
jgi:hypothetical protein